MPRARRDGRRGRGQTMEVVRRNAVTPETHGKLLRALRQVKTGNGGG